MDNGKTERPKLFKGVEQQEVQARTPPADPSHNKLVVRVSKSTVHAFYRFLIIILSFGVLLILLTLGKNAFTQLQNQNKAFDPISTTLSAQVGGIVDASQDPEELPVPPGQIGEGIQTEREPGVSEPEVTTPAQASFLGHSEQGYYKVLLTQQIIKSSGLWNATDYAQGDIITQDYTVQIGDTLWELAEGYYGSGFAWTKILEENSSTIGFLPDGSQALIIPGQLLVLP